MTLTPDEATTLSKQLSAILRHKNSGRDLKFTEEGFVDVDDILLELNERNRIGRPITVENLHEALSYDERGRFEIAVHDFRNSIRAVSGHSFDVVSNGEPYTPEGPLWFGTSMQALGKILEHGLTQSKKIRTRLLRTRDAAEQIAASRTGDPLLVEVDAPRMAADGFLFEAMPNGEILSAPVPASYCTLHPEPTKSHGPK